MRPKHVMDQMGTVRFRPKADIQNNFLLSKTLNEQYSYNGSVGPVDHKLGFKICVYSSLSA